MIAEITKSKGEGHVTSGRGTNGATARGLARRRTRRADSLLVSQEVILPTDWRANIRRFREADYGYELAGLDLVTLSMTVPSRNLGDIEECVRVVCGGRRGLAEALVETFKHAGEWLPEIIERYSNRAPGTEPTAEGSAARVCE